MDNLEKKDMTQNEIIEEISEVEEIEEDKENLEIKITETDELITSFEYNVTNEEEEVGFIVFQKKHIYKKNIIKTIGFGIIALGFAVSLYRNPSSQLNFILLLISLAGIVIIWYNMKKIRQSLMQALKMLEDDRYIFSLYDDKFVIQTIQTEEEKAEEDYFPIKPRVIEFSEHCDIIELKEMFVIILKKDTIYVIPKRCLTDSQEKILKDKFSQILKENFSVMEK